MNAADRKKLVQIAKQHIPSLAGREDLEAQNMDELDFFEASVWGLEAALIAAYELGRAAAEKK